MKSLLGTSAALFAICAAASEPMVATRSTQRLEIDGALDEPAWQLAPRYTDFTESWPTSGAAPTQKTEVRVLYDDANLYVGVICFDTEPDQIVRALGRRDSAPPADLVEVGIDSSFDRRSAYYFSVNAAGVLRDALLFGDVDFSDTWDAVWRASVARRPDGWSAEFAIPLSALRFPAAHEQKWGFEVRRTIPRTHQVFDSTLIPRNSNAGVSRFGVLTGLIDLKPKRDVELVPYAGARLNWRPQYSDSTRPRPTLLDPSVDLGLDVRAALFSDLTLNATLNPDFGQVEADQLILNLSNSELFFPEKRPFFNQGLDLFQPVGNEYGVPHQLFYSRRIGLDVPIFAAAKVTGTVAPGWQVGALDAVVVGDADPGKRSVAFQSPSTDELSAAEASPSRGVSFHWSHPLHLGPNDELPADRPTPKNFLATVVRRDVSDNLSFGAMFASASPLTARCVESDFTSRAAYEATSCAGQGGQTAGLSWNARTQDKEWVFLGMLDGSRREGGPTDDVQRDGTVIHPGDLGIGGYFKAGKFGGEGFRADLGGHLSSPKEDLNATGYMNSQNQQRLGAGAHYVRTEGLDHVRDLSASVYVNTFFTSDGRWTPRGDYAGWEGNVTLKNYWSVGCGMNVEIPHYDVREIDGSGVPYERRGSVSAYVYGGSDPNKLFNAHGFVYGYRTFAVGPVAPQTGWGAEGTFLLRPSERFETKLDFHYGFDPNGARYVDVLSDADVADPSRQHFLFGQQDSENFSLTLRQTVVFTPTLTLQAYAQFFTAYAHYPRYFSASAMPGGKIQISDLTGFETDANADFHDAALNANIVLRWEYRPGSTLFLVYSRSQRELGFTSPQVPTPSLLPPRLGPGPTSDTVMLKFSYWFNV